MSNNNLQQKSSTMTEEKTPNYSEIHQEHRQWLTTLNFYHDEIKYFQTRLAEMASRDDEDQFHQKIINFKASFFDMLQKIDELRYSIYKHEKKVVSEYELSKRTRVSINDDHHSKKNEIQQFEKDYEQLKKDFNNFLKEME